MGNTYVICGANGRVGSLVARELLAEGHRVRVVGRDRDRLAGLAGQGADVRAGSLRDADFLTGAMRGADAAFVLSPVDVVEPDVNAAQRAVVRATGVAVRESGIDHVVALSSWGAELSEPVGGIIACHWLERSLERIDRLNALCLRPVWFMENFLWNIGLIKSAGFNGLAIPSDVPFPSVATRDIAAVAARQLSTLSFEGHTVHYLNGARDYTMAEATTVIGAAIGQPDLRYLRLPGSVLRKGMVTSGGMSPDAARLAADINSAIGTGQVRAEPRSAGNTTPTTLEEFARTTFEPAFRAAPAAGWRDRTSGLLLRSFLAARTR